MTKFNIAVTSDTFCYIGKKKLEAGIAAYKAANPSSEDTFRITWHPFQLDPSAPSPGVDKRAFYRAKFGDDPARIAAMQGRMTDIGSKIGIKFSFGGQIGNSRDSHRLIDLAKSKGEETQNKVVERLFQSYFENEKDISDQHVLQEAGISAGLPEAEIKQLWAGDEHGPEVDKELVQARRNLVTGVPNFIIQGNYEIQGAQEAETFRQIFEKIAQIEN